MIIQHNILAMNNLIVGKQLQKSKAKNMERLSSGYRINRAADDAANMAISEKMHSRIRALARCQQNIEEGISLAQTADGALHEVNNMLNRAAELCVQAANDTNTTEDRSKIAAEITQIYDEMDRVFETTEFNTMKIFRHDGDNYYGPDPEYLYHESITELPPGDLHSWGTGMFPTKQFDLAKEATAATATLTLGQNINLNDVSSLNGTSFNINKNGIVYKFEFGTAQRTGSTSNNGYYVNTTEYNTVQKAFNRIKSYHSDFISDIAFSGNQAKFTFTMPNETKTITYWADTNGDGQREKINAQETVANGAKNNNISISCEGNTLNPIGFSADAMRYNETATFSLRILPNMQDPTTQLPPAGYNDATSYLTSLSYNSLQLFSNSDALKLDFLATSSATTVGELRQEITDAINNDATLKNKFSAVHNPSTGTIDVTITGLSKQTSSYGYVEEDVGTHSPEPPCSAETIPLSIQSSTPSSEALTTHTFTLPTFDPNKIYQIKVKNYYYLLYDNTKYPNYDLTENDNSHSYHSWGASSIEQAFINALSSDYSNEFTITRAGSKVTMTSKSLNNTTPIIIEEGNPDVMVTLQKKSKAGLGLTPYYENYYNKEYSVTLDFSNAMPTGFDASKLVGTGFKLNNKYYQFYTPGSDYVKYNKDTSLIDVSSITGYSALADALRISGLDVSLSNDIITLKGIAKTNSSTNYYNNFSDGGPSGTFSTNAVSSGGAAYKNPQAEINFGAYDVDNLDELYGTGFRLTCASCPGEFVNVMFCHDKSELNYPKEFNYTDANGNTSVIRNYMVELKDVTSGSQIAAYIADQLKNDLDHFTEVKVSDTNPSILIAQDKRSEDQPTGRGQVLAGVYTNFLYNVLPEKLPNLGDKVGGGRKDTDAYYAYCMIYAGDTREKPYIPVHLPHFSVENLKLEYPKEPWDSYEEITDVMNRSRNAAEVVSMARSKIGADQNRLEHAFDYAANAEEQIAAANSRIEDTDMAEEVTTQAKLTILSNTQEAILSQIIDLPERILPLLQQ